VKDSRHQDENGTGCKFNDTHGMNGDGILDRLALRELVLGHGSSGNLVGTGDRLTVFGDE